MDIIRKSIYTSEAIRDFRDERLRILKSDDSRINHGAEPRNIDELEALDLKTNVMRRFSFLLPVCKNHGFENSVRMELCVEPDTIYMLRKFTGSLGLKPWTNMVQFYYAYLLEEKKCKR